MEQLRVLFLASSDGVSLNQTGGAGSNMRGTIEGFEQHGIKVLPVIGGDLGKANVTTNNIINSAQQQSPRNSLKRLLPDKIRLLLRDARTFYRAYRFRKHIIEQIKQFDPHLIYERSALLSNIGNRLAKELAIPLFLETDGCMIEITANDYGIFSKTISNYIEKRKLQKADCVVVYNETSIPFIAKKFNLAQQSFAIKKLGIKAVMQQAIDENKKKALVEQYNLQDKFVVGFVGAISKYHGVKSLLDAAELLITSSPAIVFIIVGWSAEAKEIKTLAEQKKLTNIIFTGKIPKEDVASFYALFHIGIIPDSDPYIYPIKVLEYGLFGACPFVPDYPVFDEIIKEHATGFFFQRKNAADIAAKLSLLADKPDEVKVCAVNWNALVKEEFAWKKSVQPVVEAFYKWRKTAE